MNLKKFGKTITLELHGPMYLKEVRWHPSITASSLNMLVTSFWTVTTKILLLYMQK